MTFGKLADLSTNPELEDAVKLDTLFGKPIIVSAFDIIQVGANDCVLMKTDQGKISSFSKVIIDQLKLMQPELEKGVKFKVRPVKEKNYYKFEDVEE